ncbi:MAG: tetratricopeptide (TPR) repeat protein, partial [Kiritimatiellia bacterium]
DEVASVEARADLLLDVATFYYAHHEYKRCTSALSRARRLLDNPPDPLALKVAITQSRLALADADWQEAEQHLSRALTLADGLNDLPSVGGVLRDLGSVAFRRGAITQAHRRYERARLVLLEGGGLGDLASVINNLGECARVLGDFQSAERHYRESVALFNRAGASAAAQYPYINLGLLLTRAGRHADALVPLTHALDELSTESSRSFEAIVRVLLVPCCAALQDWAGLTLQLDRLEKADDKMPELEPELADSLVEAAQTCIDERHVVEAARCYALAARLYTQMDRPDAAQTCLDTKEQLRVDPMGSGEHHMPDT